MKKQSFNEGWNFRKSGSSQLPWAVELPHDAMLYEKRSLDADTGATTGYYEGDQL